MIKKVKIKNKPSSKKIKWTVVPVVLCCLLLSVFIINPVFAEEKLLDQATNIFSEGVGFAVAAVVGFIAMLLTTFLGLILTLLVKILVNVAQFEQFINVTTVNTGWVIIRDLCNMFFVLVFLVIAFSTILRMEQYNAKKMLPKLLIMAVLINFSKTIFGFIIGFSQVIMMQFVDAFKDNGPGNFINMFMVRDFLSIKAFNPKNTEAVSNWHTTVGIITALLALIITIIVVLVLLGTLVIRIIMLWIYVILSPLVFLGFAFPPIAKYTGQIWEDFIKYAIVGPVLAFFLYLALFTASQSVGIGFNKGLPENQAVGSKEVCAGPSAFFCESKFQTYIITIALLIGGLMVTQQIGGAAGALAGRGMAAAKSAGMKYTGARWASERWGAFQGQREQLRKGKAAMTGARMFAAYEGVAQAPKAGLAGLRSITTAKLPGLKDVQFVKDWRSKNDEKARARANLYNAYEKLKNKPVGSAPEEIEGYRYSKNAKGGLDVKDSRGNDLMSTSKAGMEFRQAAKAAYSPAKQIIDEAKNARVQKESKNFDNLSPAELRRILTSAINSKDQKMAAAMMIARKDKFDNPDQLQNAKNNLLDSPSLMKDFNDSVNKRHGLMNYTKKNAAGDWEVDEAAFKAKVEDGTINISNLDTSQLSHDEKSIDLIAKISGPKFKDTLEGMIRSDKDKDNIKAALGNNIAQRTFDKTDLQIRNAYANQSGNVNEAFRDSSGNVDSKARNEAIKNMKSKDLGRMNLDLFNDPVFTTDFAKTINFSQLKSLERSGESPEKLRKFVQEIKALKSTTTDADIQKLIDDIEYDRNLDSIK